MGDTRTREKRTGANWPPPWMPPEPRLPEQWDTAAAVQVMTAADDQVEQHGCRGRDPGVQREVMAVATAFKARDMAGVRTGCAAVVAAARGK